MSLDHGKRWKKIYNLDPFASASRIQRTYPNVKILLTIREQVDWLHSAYKYSMPALPGRQRAFSDFCCTPTGIAYLQAGHFDQTIRAYVHVFGSDRVRVLRFEDITRAPKRFVAELCAFLEISERPLPAKWQNETNAQMARLLRLFPIVDLLPRSVKYVLKPYAQRLPGGRGTILTPRDVQMVRGIYAASNQRTEKLLAQLSALPAGQVIDR